MHWELKVDRVALKQLQRLPQKDMVKIWEAIESTAQDPFSGDIKRMQGDDAAWRRRVGNYRFFYKLRWTEKIVYVYNVERRTSNTYRK